MSREIGDDTVLEFKPEVMGDEFLDAFESLQEMLGGLGIDPTNLAGVDADKLKQAVTAVRLFLADLMMPESAERFARWDVVDAGEVVFSTGHPEEARGHASDLGDGAKVVDAGMRLPDRTDRAPRMGNRGVRPAPSYVVARLCRSIAASWTSCAARILGHAV